MHYGFVIPGGDVETLIDIAQQIEMAGWDGVFIADAVYGIDPWVALTAIAMRTQRVRIGTLLTPASRRRPWKLASETATLDHISRGRVTLSVGLGAIDTGFANVGEQTERKVRAALLDECLEVMQGFWSGKPFHYDGNYYHVDWNLQHWLYPSLQQPRIPIWVVGAWPGKQSMRRALRYDGLLTARIAGPGNDPFAPITPSEVQDIKRFVEVERIGTTPFDIIVEGVTPLEGAASAEEIVAPFVQAGASWWIESMWESPGGLDAVRARIRQGPPRL